MELDEGSQSSDSDLLVPQSQTRPKVKRKRNPLSVAQKVAVIRAFDRKPSVRGLAVMFKCGRTQIKNILKNRKLHMQEYEFAVVQEPPEQKQKVTEAVAIVLHEWVTRALCYQIQINDEILRRFGCEVAEQLDGCKSVDLTPEWITSFRQKYGLTDAEMREKRLKSTQNDTKKSLNVNNVVEDMRQRLGPSIIPKCQATSSDSSVSADNLKRSRWKIEETTKKYKKKELLARGEKQMSARNKSRNFEVAYVEAEAKVTPAQEEIKATRVNVREINSYKEALNHLKPLEEFLLIKENVRAICLINQLENSFRRKLDDDER